MTDESSADQASIPSDEPKLNSHQRKKLKLREQRMVIKAERKAAQQAKKCLNSQFKTTTEGGVVRDIPLYLFFLMSVSYAF